MRRGSPPQPGNSRPGQQPSRVALAGVLRLGDGGCGELGRAGQALSASTAPAPHWPGGEEELRAQQETPIGAAHEVQTKRRNPEGDSIYLLGFLLPCQPIKKYRDTVVLELYIKYFSSWQCLLWGCPVASGCRR